MTRRLGIEDLYDLMLPEQPAVSPDGSRIAYVLRTVDRPADKDVFAIWEIAAKGGTVRQLTRGTADTAPRWSPDGARIAFLRSRDSAPQLWLLPAAGGEAEQITTLPLGAGTPVWSPDGNRIAFTAPVDTAAQDGEDEAARARRRRAPVVTDRLDHKTDDAGVLGTVRTHVHVLDVETGELRQVTSGDWHAGDPAWSPDGTLLAFPAAPDADADLTFRSGAYVIGPEARTATPRLTGSGKGIAGPVVWTADGAALLVAGRRDTAAGHTSLLRVPLDGGETVDLTASLDRNLMSGGPGYPGGPPTLTEDGRVLFCVRDRGCTHLYAVDVTGGTPQHVAGRVGDTIGGLSAAGGTVALVLATPTSFGELAAVTLGAEAAYGPVRVLTDHGANIEGTEQFVREEREFTISDGTVVHGWLVRDPARKGPLPLLLDIHGGPHNAWNGTADSAHLYHQILAARGWAVLLLNPRGSDGYGEEFHTAVVGAWGTADAADFLEPLDQLVTEGLADRDRLAVAGYSYGGYMTCYLTSRDNRFAAAVAGGVVSDLTSMAGTSDSGHLLGALELGRFFWEAENGYAPQSPLTHVDQVRTPTLILHGADDLRCPVGQAEQWFTALRERGVPARLVTYPGSSHLFIFNGTVSHRADYNSRIVDWVERHTPAHGRAPRVPLDAAHWQRRLTDLARRHRIPGAALGILRLGPDGADEMVLASHGVLNNMTGVEVTDDSLFQIGSITKVWTATLVMQLVDEGLLDLDAPIINVLPELRLPDADVAKQVTMRHLLAHTSGIDGDVFTDTGRGDDCLERYVDLLADVGQNHPLGVTFSYCNSGFVVAGRVIEKLTGKSWDTALRERLLTPLGLDHTVTLPEEALLHRAAVGHLSSGDGDGEPEPAPVWVLPRSMGPAGLVAAATQDVLDFARLHLTGGLTADGKRLLAQASAQEMTERHADLPDKHAIGDSWGLGWARFDWGGHQVIGHDGGTIGQVSFLRLLPEQGLAVVLLTNGGGSGDLYAGLYCEIFADLAGVSMQSPLVPAAEPPAIDGMRHIGVYERASARTEVFASDNGLRLRQTLTGPMAEVMPEPIQEFDLVPVTDTLFVFCAPGSDLWTAVKFYSLPTGEPYIHFGARAAPKIA